MEDLARGSPNWKHVQSLGTRDRRAWGVGGLWLQGRELGEQQAIVPGEAGRGQDLRGCSLKARP